VIDFVHKLLGATGWTFHLPN